MTLTLKTGEKWTFTNVTVGAITDGTAHDTPTESLSLNFTKVEHNLQGTVAKRNTGTFLSPGFNA